MAKDFAKRFYDSKVWGEARAYALKRDRYLCQDCKSAPAEEVHHIEWIHDQTSAIPLVTSLHTIEEHILHDILLIFRECITF